MHVAAQMLGVDAPVAAKPFAGADIVDAARRDEIKEQTAEVLGAFWPRMRRQFSDALAVDLLRTSGVDDDVLPRERWLSPSSFGGGDGGWEAATPSPRAAVAALTPTRGGPATGFDFVNSSSSSPAEPPSPSLGKGARGSPRAPGMPAAGAGARAKAARARAQAKAAQAKGAVNAARDKAEEAMVSASPRSSPSGTSRGSPLAAAYLPDDGNAWLRIARPSMEGWLLKEGSRVHNWKRRWVVLGASGAVSYYESDAGFSNSSSPVESAALAPPSPGAGSMSMAAQMLGVEVPVLQGPQAKGSFQLSANWRVAKSWSDVQVQLYLHTDLCV